MTDSLAQRMTDNQIRMATTDLQRDTARLAAAAQQYTDALNAGRGPDVGMADRIAQSALYRDDTQETT